jgi:hypothetical protein
MGGGTNVNLTLDIGCQELGIHLGKVNQYIHIYVLQFQLS